MPAEGSETPRALLPRKAIYGGGMRGLGRASSMNNRWSDLPCSE